MGIAPIKVHYYFVIIITFIPESFSVTVQPSPDSQRLGLKTGGQYTLRVSPEGVALLTTPRGANPPPAPAPATALAKPSAQQLDSPSPGLPQRRSSDRSLGDGALGMSEGVGVGEGEGTVSAAGRGEGEEEEEEVEVEVMAWRLSMLKRFNVEKEAASGQPRIFLLECGP